MKKKLFTKKRIIIGSIVLVIVVAALALSSGEDLTAEVEQQPVTRGNVLEVVSETGFVQASQEVSLAFERGGRIASIPVSVGSVVREGDLLVMLDTSQARAELAAAYARLVAEQVRLDELRSGGDSLSLAVGETTVESAEIALANAQKHLAETIIQQNQLVANAQKARRSIGLQAYLVGVEREGSSFSYTAPTITGIYSGTEEGVYTVRLYASGASSGYSYTVSSLETDTQNVSTVNPQPLGSRGLYIQFPDNFVRGSNVVWEVPIPNTRASTYLTYRNAYTAAVDARVVAIQTAQNTVKSAEAALKQSGQQYTQLSSSARSERIDAQRALVVQMQAAVQAAEVTVQNMTLEATFAGVVTDVNADVGEIVSPSVPAVSLVDDGNYELVVQISESDIQEVSIDDSATVLFDAYDDTRFEAKVVHIAPSAKLIEGVRAFEVTLQFVSKDERIRVGLSADIDIHAAERHDVLVVKTRAVVEREDGKFVRALHGEVVEYIPVKTGLRGSDGNTEIIEGLSEGQTVITFARDDVIEKLESRNN